MSGVTGGAQSEEPPLRVIVADDHVAMIAGVRLRCGAPGSRSVARRAMRRTRCLARALQPDVALLDIHMPGNGLSAARLIGDEVPETAVVMLTVSRAEVDLFEALRVGARGYLLKDMDPARLPQALRGVLAGEVALPRSLAARLVDEFRRREGAPRRSLLGRRRVRLSEREWETLELLHQGLSTKEIAERSS